MTDLKTICINCDEDIIITERNIRLAVMHMGRTAGKAIVTCPNCCIGLVLPDVPTDGAALEQWITKYDTENKNDWLACLPLLDPMIAKMPNGFVAHLGVKWWTPGDETIGLTALDYMLRYGLNPACAWAKMQKSPI